MRLPARACVCVCVVQDLSDIVYRIVSPLRRMLVNCPLYARVRVRVYTFLCRSAPPRLYHYLRMNTHRFRQSSEFPSASQLDLNDSGVMP